MDDPTVSVAAGDTLVSISVRCGVSVSVLKRINRLSGDRDIYEGKVLKLTSSSPFKERTSFTEASSDSSVGETLRNGGSVGGSIKASDRGGSGDRFRPQNNVTESPGEREGRGKEPLFSWDNVFASLITSAPVVALSATAQSISSSLSSSSSSSSSARSTATSPGGVDGSGVTSPAVDDTAVPSLPMPPAPRLILVPGVAHLLTPHMSKQLAPFLPIQLQFDQWTLLYNLQAHGCALSTFYQRTRRRKNTLIIVETSDGEIFGALNTDEWKVSATYYGSGESFLFAMDGASKEVTVYNWTGQNEYFIWSNEDKIAMGGGGGGFAFVLDQDFAAGSCAASATFGNPSLVKTKRTFSIVNFECWGFETRLSR
jgi:LysM repeat protein